MRKWQSSGWEKSQWKLQSRKEKRANLQTSFLSWCFVFSLSRDRASSTHACSLDLVYQLQEDWWNLGRAFPAADSVVLFLAAIWLRSERQTSKTKIQCQSTEVRLHLVPASRHILEFCNSRQLQIWNFNYILASTLSVFENLLPGEPRTWATQLQHSFRVYQRDFFTDFSFI